MVCSTVRTYDQMTGWLAGLVERWRGMFNGDRGGSSVVMVIGSSLEKELGACVR